MDIERIFQFGFIVMIAVGAVAGGLVTLFAVGALFDALDHPHELRGRIEGLFRRPAAPARETAADHYYRPHWRAS
jgi:hypothetical protein